MAIPYATKNELERLRRNLTTNSIQTISDEAELNDLLSKKEIKDGMVFFREDLQKLFKASEDADGNLIVKELSVGSDLKIAEYEVELETGKVIGLKADDLETLLFKCLQEKTLFAFYINVPEEAGKELPFKKAYIFYGFLTYQMAVEPTVMDLGVIVGGDEKELYHLKLTTNDNDEMIIQSTKISGDSPVVFDTYGEFTDNKLEINLSDSSYNEIVEKIESNSALPLIIKIPSSSSSSNSVALYCQNFAASYIKDENNNIQYFSCLSGPGVLGLGKYMVTITNITGKKSIIMQIVEDLRADNLMFLIGKTETMGTNPNRFYLSSDSVDQSQPLSKTNPVGGYFDSINDTPIIHTSETINKYYAPTTLNNEEKPKVLTSKNGELEWADAAAGVVIRRF